MGSIVFFELKWIICFLNDVLCTKLAALSSTRAFKWGFLCWLEIGPCRWSNSSLHRGCETVVCEPHHFPQGVCEIAVVTSMAAWPEQGMGFSPVWRLWRGSSVRSTVKLGDLKTSQQKEPRAVVRGRAGAHWQSSSQTGSGGEGKHVSPQFCAKVPLTRVKTAKMRKHCIV